MANTQGAAYGVHSEVGQLRKVMVCAPGRAHERLTPSNCDALLFDEEVTLDAKSGNRISAAIPAYSSGDVTLSIATAEGRELISAVVAIE